MTVEEMAKLWEQHESEAHHFEQVKQKLATRPDLHAFMLIDKLLPGASAGFVQDMIGSAEHDEIWLSVDVNAMAEKINPDQVLELVQCGIRYDTDTESLAMFV